MKKNIKHMKRIVYFLLLSFTLCSCNIDYKKIYEVDNDLAELDLTNYSLSCYNRERMEVIIILSSANKDEIFFLFLDNIFKISSHRLILDSKL